MSTEAATSGKGGSIYGLVGSGNTGAGGDITMVGGSSSAASPGTGGNVVATGGASGTGASGGLNIFGGAGSSSGGNIYLRPGVGNANSGVVAFKRGDASHTNAYSFQMNSNATDCQAHP